MDPTREQIAAALMSGAGQKMGPPAAENPMADYMGERRGKMNLGAGVYGTMTAGALLPALLDADPTGAWLSRLMAGLSGAVTADYLGKGNRAARGQDMWSNTGMPGRPVPDQQNPMVMLQKLNQMTGGDGN